LAWSCRLSWLRRSLLRFELAQLAFQHDYAIFQIAQPLFHRGFIVCRLCGSRVLGRLRNGGHPCNHYPEYE
jgi:hypothetical protein